MKNILLLITFCFLTASLKAQSPVIDWARSFPSGRTLAPQCMASFPGNGILVAGYTNIPYPANQVALLAVDSSGNLLWRDSITSVGTGSAILHLRGLASLPDGTSYVTGTFKGQLTCSGTVLNQVGTGYHEIFLVKFSAAGSLLWMKTFYGISPFPTGIVSDGSGNLVMATDIDTLNIQGSGFSARGSHDLLVVKMDPEANVIWSKQFSGDVFGKGLTVCSDGRTAVMGNFGDTLFFDSSSFTHQDNGSWESDEFLIYLDANGQIDKLNISTLGILDPTHIIPHDDKLLLSAVTAWHDCASAYQLVDENATGLWSTRLPEGGTDYGDCFMYENIASADHDRFWAFGNGKKVIDYGAGTYNAALRLVQFDFAGNIISSDTFDLPDGPSLSNAAAAGSSGSNLYFAAVYYDTLKLQSHTLYSASGEMVLFKMRSPFASAISTNDLPAAIAVRLYPNPATNQVTIISTMQQEVSVEIYDVLGKLLKKQDVTLAPGSTVLPLELSSGVFPLRICNSKTGRLICSDKLLIVEAH
ncbi:MAG: hypothetical protein JWO09_1888 [Bacteroidetes bacterium]|nr:hypothetical protein [Bacteroidota bacterium]